MFCSSCTLNKLQLSTQPFLNPFQSEIRFQTSSNKLINREPQLKGIYLSCYITTAQEGEYFADQFVSLLDIAIAYVQAKQYKQAFSIIEKWEANTSKNIVLAKIAEQYAISKQYEQALQVVENIDLSSSTYGSSIRFSVLIKIITKLAKAKQLDLALKLAYQIGDPAYKAIALAKVAENYSYFGKQREAEAFFYRSIKILETVQDDQIVRIVRSPQSIALSEISNSYVRLEQYEQAVQVAKMIANKNYQIIALSEIGIGYALKGQTEKAKEILNQAYQIAKSQPEIEKWDYPIRGKTLIKVASAYAKAGFYAQSLEVINEIGKERERIWAFIEISDIYIGTGQQKKVNQMLGKALSTAKMMKSEHEKIDALLEIASKYQESKQLEKSNQLVFQALQATNALKSNQEIISLKSTSLERISRAYVNMEQYDKAIQTAQTLEDRVRKDRLLNLIKCARQ